MNYKNKNVKPEYHTVKSMYSERLFLEDYLLPKRKCDCESCKVNGKCTCKNCNCNCGR